jgi:hypothetical protein
MSSRSPSKKIKVESKYSRLTLILIAIPVICLFFFFGIFIGSKFVSNENIDMESNLAFDIAKIKDESHVVEGLPGTYHIVEKWSKSNVGGLRGVASSLIKKEIENVEKITNSFSFHAPPDKFISPLLASDNDLVTNGDNGGNVGINEHSLGLHLPEGVLDQSNTDVVAQDHPITGSKLSYISNLLYI